MDDDCLAIVLLPNPDRNRQVLSLGPSFETNFECMIGVEIIMFHDRRACGITVPRLRGYAVMVRDTHPDG